MLPAPVIVEPFATFGDEVAGDTADEVAMNLAECAALAVRNRCKPRTPRPNLKKLFFGHKLSADSKAALARAERIFDTIKKWPEPKTA